MLIIVACLLGFFLVLERFREIPLFTTVLGVFDTFGSVWMLGGLLGGLFCLRSFLVMIPFFDFFESYEDSSFLEISEISLIEVSFLKLL